MSHYVARVEWTRHGEVFTDNRYSREHRWHFDGGVTVAASSSPQVVPAPYSVATAVDPEEAFIASLEVVLKPVIVWGGERQPDAAVLRDMHRIAHEECFIANSVRTIVRCEV